MTFEMQEKDIRQHLGDISASAMSRIFKRLRLHGIIERKQGTYKYLPTTYGKQVIATGLTIQNLYQHWHKLFLIRRNFAILSQKTLSGLKSLGAARI